MSVHVHFHRSRPRLAFLNRRLARRTAHSEPSAFFDSLTVPFVWHTRQTSDLRIKDFPSSLKQTLPAEAMGTKSDATVEQNADEQNKIVLKGGRGGRKIEGQVSVLLRVLRIIDSAAASRLEERTQ